ncbi:MAG: hypothetical protein ABSA58_08900 [Acetobacteraceae bacterium]|jgi:hypothetical protein
MARFSYGEAYGRIAGALYAAQDIMLRERGSVDRTWYVLNVCDSPVCLERLGLRKSDVSRFFWHFVARHWADFDGIPHAKFAAEFARHRAGWEPEIMTWGHPKGTDNLRTYKGLPDSVTVYRGQGMSQPVGLSWTLERDIAAAFASGPRGESNPEPVILTRTIARKDIAFVVNEREESEVVLFAPPKREKCHTMILDAPAFADAL